MPSKNESKNGDESKSNSGMKMNNSKLNNLMQKRDDGDIISNLYPFYQSKIRVGLEPFYEKYAHEFDPDESENKLIYTEIFHKFEEIFEGFLDEFIELHGLNRKSFYEELQESIEDASSRSNILVKLVIAQTDFEFFVNLMKDKSREYRDSNTRRASHK